MNIAQFLALFPTIKETRKGWDVCCPAHDDKSPSLGVMEGNEGRIVLNCLAGCENRDIMYALGLTLADLFQDRAITGQAKPLQRHMVKQPPRKRAFAYDLHALDLRLAAKKILAASAACAECETWTNEDVELALKAVGRAYIYQDRANFCESYADHLREQDYESQRLASREPRTTGTAA